MSSHHEHEGIYEIVKNNKWTLGWISVVTTVTLIIEVWQTVTGGGR